MHRCRSIANVITGGVGVVFPNLTWGWFVNSVKCTAKIRSANKCSENKNPALRNNRIAGHLFFQKTDCFTRDTGFFSKLPLQSD